MQLVFSPGASSAWLWYQCGAGLLEQVSKHFFLLSYLSLRDWDWLWNVRSIHLCVGLNFWWENFANSWFFKIHLAGAASRCFLGRHLGSEPSRGAIPREGIRSGSWEMFLMESLEDRLVTYLPCSQPPQSLRVVITFVGKRIESVGQHSLWLEDVGTHSVSWDFSLWEKWWPLGPLLSFEFVRWGR